MNFKLKSWLRCLPVSLRSRIESSPNLLKILTNTGWLFADHALRLGVGLLVGVWVARYLGPEQFGLLNYAMAFVALFSAIASLGLNGIVVRDLVKEPGTANVTLGTAFVLQVMGGLLAFAIVVLVISYTRPDDALAKLMVIVLGSAMLLKASDVVKYWFESQVHSKYTVWVENSSFLLFAGVKVLLVLGQATLMTFVWAVFAEAALVSVALFVMYAWRGGHLRDWQVKRQRAKTLLKDSWPLILSGLAIVAYMRIDQIMIGQLLGDEAVGIYSAAVRISEVWYFIPMAIVASVFPSIIEAKKHSEALYYQRLQRLYDLMVVLAFLVAVPVMFLSDWIVTLLFGQAYQHAGQVLAIHTWAGIFLALSVASGRWLIDQGYGLLAFKRNLAGALVNVGLNFYLIPIYGPIGAAYATLISFLVSAYISDGFSKKTRIAFLQKSRSLFFVNTISATKIKLENIFFKS